MSNYNPIVSTSLSTVVSEYESPKHLNDSYQSEDVLEREMIRLLTEQGYDVQIHEVSDLEVNLHKQLERLNECSFTDSERKHFF